MQIKILNDDSELSIYKKRFPDEDVYVGDRVDYTDWEDALDYYADISKAVYKDIKDSYPDNNPKTQFGVKKLPLHLVPPSANAALASAFADGAEKYGPYNWREKSISSSVYYAALQRHIMAWWDGEELAEDSGVEHLAHAMACIALIIDSKSINMLNDDRPIKGSINIIIKDYSNDNNK